MKLVKKIKHILELRETTPVYGRIINYSRYCFLLEALDGKTMWFKKIHLLKYKKLCCKWSKVWINVYALVDKLIIKYPHLSDCLLIFAD